MYTDVADDEEETVKQGLKKFKTDDSCWVMVANPAAAGEGISLMMSAIMRYTSIEHSMQLNLCNPWTESIGMG